MITVTSIFYYDTCNGNRDEYLYMSKILCALMAKSVCSEYNFFLSPSFLHSVTSAVTAFTALVFAFITCHTFKLDCYFISIMVDISDKIWNELDSLVWDKLAKKHSKSKIFITGKQDFIGYQGLAVYWKDKKQTKGMSL